MIDMDEYLFPIIDENINPCRGCPDDDDGMCKSNGGCGDPTLKEGDTLTKDYPPYLDYPKERKTQTKERIGMVWFTQRMMIERAFNIWADENGVAKVPNAVVAFLHLNGCLNEEAINKLFPMPKGGRHGD